MIPLTPACDSYSRPRGVMGGPCLNCGRTQPDHARGGRQLVNGAPVPEDGSHRELKANGQQRDYVVLTPEERAKGFVKPVRDSYLHKTCGVVTKMGFAIAETYARNPNFYSGTFCVGCHTHFPLIEFTWEPDGEPMDTSLQEEWHKTNTARLAKEKQERRERRIAELKRELASLESEL